MNNPRGGQRCTWTSEAAGRHYKGRYTCIEGRRRGASVEQSSPPAMTLMAGFASSTWSLEMKVPLSILVVVFPWTLHSSPLLTEHSAARKEVVAVRALVLGRKRSVKCALVVPPSGSTAPQSVADGDSAQLTMPFSARHPWCRKMSVLLPFCSEFPPCRLGVSWFGRDSGSAEQTTDAKNASHTTCRPIFGIAVECRSQRKRKILNEIFGPKLTRVVRATGSGRVGGYRHGRIRRGTGA